MMLYLSINKTEKVQSKTARQVCDRENIILIKVAKVLFKKSVLNKFFG